MKKNTGHRVYVELESRNWKFERALWEDESGRFIIVNGTRVSLDFVIDNSDYYYIVMKLH